MDPVTGKEKDVVVNVCHARLNFDSLREETLSSLSRPSPRRTMQSRRVKETNSRLSKQQLRPLKSERVDRGCAIFLRKVAAVEIIDDCSTVLRVVLVSERSTISFPARIDRKIESNRCFEQSRGVEGYRVRNSQKLFRSGEQRTDAARPFSPRPFRERERERERERGGAEQSEKRGKRLSVAGVRHPINR